MTVQDWGAIGEIVSAVAVVVTLGYLASQIRYARMAAGDASRQHRAHGVRDMLLSQVNNAEYRRAWTKADPEGEARMAGLAEILGVSTEEADMVWAGGCAWAFLHWSQYRSMKTPDDERELENLVSTFYSRLPMSALWNHDAYFKDLLDPGFVAWVDSVLTRSDER